MSRPILRRVFLVSTLGVLGAGCVWGVTLLALDSRFSDRSERVIATALTTGLLGLIALTSWWVWEHGRRRALVLLAVILGSASYVLCQYMLWGHPRWNELNHEGRLLISGTICTACLLLLSVLAVARLGRPWRMVSVVTQELLVALAGASIFLELCYRDQSYLRLVGILMLASACGLVSVVVLQCLGAPRPSEAVTTALVLHIVCPRCAEPQELAAGHSRCRLCGLRLHIEIEEERCAKCGYVLYRLTSDRCPECGTPVAMAVEETRGD